LICTTSSMRRLPECCGDLALICGLVFQLPSIAGASRFAFIIRKSSKVIGNEYLYSHSSRLIVGILRPCVAGKCRKSTNYKRGS
jgi:hypothetical protein